MSNKTHVYTNTMKTLILTTFLVSTLVSAAENPDLVAVVLDDQTGEELARDHGIQPLEMADFSPCLEAILSYKKGVRLHHLAIDEEAGDNAASTLTFQPYSGPNPPARVPSNLSFKELQKRTAEYRKTRALWQKGIISYRKSIVTDITTFLRQVTLTQQEISERFDQLLLERNGRDFNRSDITTSISKANALLEGSKQPFLILNSDCVDRPGKGEPQKTALTPEQLSPKVTLIFVNTSLKPQREAIFRGLKNPVIHVKTMKEAMEAVGSQLKPSQP